MKDQIKKDPGLFDYLNDLSYGKKYLFEPGLTKNYSQYMLNRGFGQHIDTVLLANMMNQLPDLTDQQHHDFYYYGVDQRKRFGKWAKQQTENEQAIVAIQNKYKVNRNVAMIYHDLLDGEHIRQLINEQNEIGGLKK